MPLGTLDRTPPPFFKQGPSALSKLVVFSAIALFLMVADLRFKVATPLRTALATVLYPGQWLVMQPIEAAMGVRAYLTSLERSRTLEAEASQRLARQSERSQQVEQLSLENRRLRELLGLRERAQVEGIGAQVLYDAADPYTRRVVIDRGQTHGVKAGAPVIDEAGVPTIEAHGYTDGTCRAATKEIEEALGIVEKRKIKSQTCDVKVHVGVGGKK